MHIIDRAGIFYTISASGLNCSGGGRGALMLTSPEHVRCAERFRLFTRLLIRWGWLNAGSGGLDLQRRAASETDSIESHASRFALRLLITWRRRRIGRIAGRIAKVMLGGASQQAFIAVLRKTCCRQQRGKRHYEQEHSRSHGNLLFEVYVSVAHCRRLSLLFRRRWRWSGWRRTLIDALLIRGPGLLQTLISLRG